MRLLVVILALGMIGWLFYMASGGEDADTAIPTGYQQSLEKAEALEGSLQESSEKRLEDLDTTSP